MDDMDLKILRILQEDSAISMVDLALKVGLSHTPCWRRIKRLREAGLIDKRVTLLNPAMLGFGVTVVVELTLKRQDEASLAQFERAVMLIDNVMQCYAMTGDKHFMLILVAESVGGRIFFTPYAVVFAPTSSRCCLISVLTASCRIRRD